MTATPGWKRDADARRRCPSCHVEAGPDSRFCVECGTLLEAPHHRSPSRPPAEAVSSPDLAATLRAVLPAGPAPPATVGEARLALAQALLAAGRAGEARAQADAGLAEEGSPQVDLLAVRAGAGAATGSRGTAIADAWTAVDQRRAPAGGLFALAALARPEDGLTRLARHRRPAADASAAPDEAVWALEQDAAAFVLLATGGRFEEAVDAVRRGRFGEFSAWSPPPHPVDAEALRQVWAEAHGPLVAEVLTEILAALVRDPSITVDPVEPDHLVGAEWVLRLPLLRVRAAAAAANGDPAAAVEGWVQAALAEDLDQRLDTARADLAAALALDPDHQFALLLSCDYRRLAVARSSGDPDPGELRLAREEWERAVAAKPVGVDRAWAYQALGAILESLDTGHRAESWAALAAHCSALVVSDRLGECWLDVARAARSACEPGLQAAALRHAEPYFGEDDDRLLLEQVLFPSQYDSPAAVALYDRLGERVEASSPLRFLRGWTRLRLGDSRGAEQDLAAVQPPDVDARLAGLLHGTALACLGLPEDARALLEDVERRLRPSVQDGSATWTWWHAVTLALVGDPAEAEHAVTGLLARQGEVSVEDPDLFGLEVLCAVATGDAERAHAAAVRMERSGACGPSVEDVQLLLLALIELRPGCTGLAVELRATLTRLRTRPAPDADSWKAEDPADPATGASRRIALLLFRIASRRYEGGSEGSRGDLERLAGEPELPWYLLRVLELAGADDTLGSFVEDLAHERPAVGADEAVRAAGLLAPEDPHAVVADRLCARLGGVADLWRAYDAFEAVAGADERFLVRDRLRAEVLRRIGSTAGDVAKLDTPAIVVELGSWLVPGDAVDHWEHWSLFGDLIPAMRDRIEARTGVRPPGVRVRPGLDLGDDEARVSWWDEPATAAVFEVAGVNRPAGPILRPDGTPSPAADHETRALGALLDGVERRVVPAMSRLVGVDDVAALLETWSAQEPAIDPGTPSGPVSATAAAPGAGVVGAARAGAGATAVGALAGTILAPGIGTVAGAALGPLVGHVFGRYMAARRAAAGDGAAAVDLSAAAVTSAIASVRGAGGELEVPDGEVRGTPGSGVADESLRAVRATALVRALLDERIPVRADAVSPVVEALPEFSHLGPAVEAVRLASLAELLEAAAGRPVVPLPERWDRVAPGASRALGDEDERNRLLADIAGRLADRPAAVVTVRDAALRQPLALLLRPHFPDVSVFLAEELSARVPTPRDTVVARAEATAERSRGMS